MHHQHHCFHQQHGAMVSALSVKIPVRPVPGEPAGTATQMRARGSASLSPEPI